MTMDYSGDPPTLPSEGLVPIRTVASLTGVNPVTLRAWERRYGLIKPVRTPKGHRLYTMADVDFIHQVTALLEAGMSIGQVRQVLNPESGEESEETPANDLWTTYQRGMIRAIERFDESAIDELYNEALSLYPVDIVTSRLIVPLLREVGWRWERAEGNVAEEHFFSVYLRNKLGARFHHLRRKSVGPQLVAACVSGEQHDVGILLFSLAALDRNYRVILLGSNMPVEELPLVIQRTNSQAIVLSGSPVAEITSVQQELLALVKRVKVPVFVGGKIATRHPEELRAAGAVIVGEDLNLALRKVDSVLNSGSAQK